jgi:branched-chain amino acid transport system substrate-binding protein
VARGRWAAVCSCVLALAAAGCGEDEDDRRVRVVLGGTLTIYSSLPRHGESLRVVRDVTRAEGLALEEARGRAGRWRIRHVPLDNADPETGIWDADRTSVNARTALRDATTIAYLGELDSEATAISLPILNEAGILQVSATNTYVGLTRDEGAATGEPERFFPTGQRTYGRVIPADHVQAAALATLMGEEDCLSTLLLDDGEAFGDGLAENVQRAARAQELDLAGRATIGEDPATLRAAADRVARTDPDCLLLAVGVPTAGAAGLLRELGAARPTMRFLGPSTLDDAAFLAGLGGNVETQLHVTAPELAPDAYPVASQRFYRAFRAGAGRLPAPEAIYAYEAMKAVLRAIEDAGELGNDRAEVIAAFLGLQDRESVLGTYDIDDNGDTTLDTYGAYRVRAGRLEFDQVVEPPDG